MKLQKWLDETSDDEMLTKLSHLHPADYHQIELYLRKQDLMGAIRFLRFEAKDKVVALDGAYYFVKLVQRMENITLEKGQ